MADITGDNFTPPFPGESIPGTIWLKFNFTTNSWEPVKETVKEEETQVPIKTPPPAGDKSAADRFEELSRGMNREIDEAIASGDTTQSKLRKEVMKQSGKTSRELDQWTQQHHYHIGTILLAFTRYFEHLETLPQPRDPKLSRGIMAYEMLPEILHFFGIVIKSMLLTDIPWEKTRDIIMERMSKGLSDDLRKRVVPDPDED